MSLDESSLGALLLDSAPEPDLPIEELVRGSLARGKRLRRRQRARLLAQAVLVPLVVAGLVGTVWHGLAPARRGGTGPVTQPASSQAPARFTVPSAHQLRATVLALLPSESRVAGARTTNVHKRGAPAGKHPYLDLRVDTGHGFHYVTAWAARTAATPEQYVTAVDCAGGTCLYRTFADGSRAVIFAQGGTSWISRSVILVRSDGAVIAVQATNQISVATKTHSDRFGGWPALSVPQMIAIVTSDRW
jgi:hypothetical protein